MVSQANLRGRIVSNIGSARTLFDAAPVLTAESLHGVFQPIVDVANCVVFGHEGLIRGPVNSSVHLPAALFREANAAGLGDKLEFTAADVILASYRRSRGTNLLFVNFSARSITHIGSDLGREHFCNTLLRCDMPARSLVIEITEHERVTDHSGLAQAIRFLRGLGVAIALDDFGDGSSSLRLWAELQPEFVKIDRYFCNGIHSDGKKVQTVKAMLRLAENFGSRVIAEGIEEGSDLRIIRDLGIGFVQGYATGRPAVIPAGDIPAAALSVLAARDIAVFPELRRAFHYSPKADQLLIEAPPVTAASTNHDLLELFQRYPQLHAVAVLEEGRPVGLVNRRRFTDKYMLPYYPEIYGRKSCSEFMDCDPVVIETSQPLEDLVQVLTSEDQRYLSDGYILVDAGRYVGLGTAEQLVRSVTELRIEAARHANPLTFLPGNIPISEHVRRLIAGDNGFAASYCDLNNFKPFNDQFGYWHGDKMIRLLAGVIVGECDPQRDFAGHIGGDDFVVLFQSADWENRCTRIISRFNAAALTLFDGQTRDRGYIESEDRQGNPTRFPLTTLSIGALQVTPGVFHAPEDVASAAAIAKHQAKKLASGFYIQRPQAAISSPAALVA
jgi:EAL domain-containing protein (putative c-di-GMP-specific phosphodiesterase class I)/GGDEF domain-containing protein